MIHSWNNRGFSGLCSSIWGCER